MDAVKIITSFNKTEVKLFLHLGVFCERVLTLSNIDTVFWYFKEENKLKSIII